MHVSGVCTLAVLPSGALSGYLVEQLAGEGASRGKEGEGVKEGEVERGEGEGEGDEVVGGGEEEAGHARRYLGMFGRPVPATSARDCWQEDDDFQLYSLTFVDFATRDEASVFAIKSNYDACRLRLADQEGDGAPASTSAAASCEGLRFETHTLLAGDDAERALTERFPPGTRAKLAARDAIVNIGPASVWGLRFRNDRIRQLEHESWGDAAERGGTRRTQAQALGPALDMGEWGPGDAGVFAAWEDEDEPAPQPPPTTPTPSHRPVSEPPNAKARAGAPRGNLPANAASAWTRAKRPRHANVT